MTILTHTTGVIYFLQILLLFVLFPKSCNFARAKTLDFKVWLPTEIYAMPHLE